MLYGLFRECHSLSAAVDNQCPEATKQPHTHDWSAASKQLLCEIAVLFGTEETLLLHISIPDGILLLCLLLRCSWDQWAPPPVASFMGSDDVLSPLRWTYTHLHRCMKTQGGLADNSFYFSAYFHLAQVTFLCFLTKW